MTFLPYQGIIYFVCDFCQKRLFSRRLFVSLAPDCGKFFSILGAKDDVIMKDMALMSCINKIISFYISCKQNTCPSKDKISLHFFFEMEVFAITDNLWLKQMQ